MSDCILFAQHGWADTHHHMRALAQQLAPVDTPIVAPDLGFVNTWLRIAPLIATVEQQAAAALAAYPQRRARIIGHSMGGLIWLEVLQRHPEWWPRVESVVLIASGVGGIELGRIIDPLRLGIGIARDLAVNRRALAEAVAAAIPTLVIAGDFGEGSDLLVPVAATQVHGARTVIVPRGWHPALRRHPLVVAVIRQFWATLSQPPLPVPPAPLVERLRSVPGMTDTDLYGLRRARVALLFCDGTTIRLWHNLAGVPHIYLVTPHDGCAYSGFVGWLHTWALHEVLQGIRRDYAERLLPM
jgi:pimeloyl-ACP methyl ester carboxylesterase